MNTREEAEKSGYQNVNLIGQENNRQQFFRGLPTIKMYQSNQFSFVTLLKHSLPGILAGITILCIKAYLPLMLSCTVPPLALTLLAIAGGSLIAYGIVQGLDYANEETHPDDCEEDVEPVTPSI